MRIPRDVIYVYWLQDVSGAWLLSANTSRQHINRHRRDNIRAGYVVTEVKTHVRVD